MAMHWIYSCPHCQARLNPGERIVLRASAEGRSFAVGLHPQPGNYSVELPPGEVMAQGSRWELSCPVCERSLASELSADLCALDLVTAGESHRVYFSCVAGEEATFVVSAEGLVKDFGIHTDRYLEHLVHSKYMR
ncbi:MAG: hypothetical protein MUE90_04830 [Thermoanaerobaculales bacterium]|nr:hypothetical protein [Thermoanaerobaculales bacterium]